jgi:hypothetical protein
MPPALDHRRAAMGKDFENHIRLYVAAAEQ